jgi:hypothetical protein
MLLLSYQWRSYSTGIWNELQRSNDVMVHMCASALELFLNLKYNYPTVLVWASCRDQILKNTMMSAWCWTLPRLEFKTFISPFNWFTLRFLPLRNASSFELLQPSHQCTGWWVFFGLVVFFQVLFVCLFYFFLILCELYIMHPVPLISLSSHICPSPFQPHPPK